MMRVRTVIIVLLISWVSMSLSAQGEETADTCGWSVFLRDRIISVGATGLVNDPFGDLEQAVNSPFRTSDCIRMITRDLRNQIDIGTDTLLISEALFFREPIRDPTDIIFFFPILPPIVVCNGDCEVQNLEEK